MVRALTTFLPLSDLILLSDSARRVTACLVMLLLLQLACPCFTELLCPAAFPVMFGPVVELGAAEDEEDEEVAVVPAAGP